MLLCLERSHIIDFALHMAGIWEVQNLSAITRRCGGVEQRGMYCNDRALQLTCEAYTIPYWHEAPHRKWTLRKLKLNSWMSKSGSQVTESDSCKKVPVFSLTWRLRSYLAISCKLQHQEHCAELQGLGTFLTLEELIEKDESLLQQVQGCSGRCLFMHSCILNHCLPAELKIQACATITKSNNQEHYCTSRGFLTILCCIFVSTSV